MGVEADTLADDPLLAPLTVPDVRRVAGPGGFCIRAAYFPARKRNPKASFIVSPGRTEFIEKYLEVVCELLDRGYSVLVVDQRGQGASDRLLPERPMAGHMDDFALAAQHLGLAIAAYEDVLAACRLLLCHSMGGAIGLQGLLERQLPGVIGAVFSAPMWGLKTAPGAVPLVTLLNRIGRATDIAPMQPKTWRPEPFEGNQVTTDPKRFARTNAQFLADPRVQIAGATNGWVGAALDIMNSFTAERLASLDFPVLVLSGGAETVVENDAHVRIAGAISGASLRVIPDAKHELLQEVDGLRSRVWEWIDQWLAEAFQDHTVTSKSK